jgi:hypothetical protein
MKTHLVWLCLSIAALFVGTRFAKEEIRVVEKPVEVFRTKEVVVEKPVEVIREVPKEVEKIVEKRVEVPAEIPSHYLAAQKFAESFFKADCFKKDEILTGISSVQVAVNLADPQKSKISEGELKDLIELSLRRNGVPVKGDSPYFLIFDVSGLWDDSGITYSYSATLALNESVRLLRSSAFKIAPLVIWQNSYNGYAGKQKVGDGITNSAEKLVVSFSNAYLAANPK